MLAFRDKASQPSSELSRRNKLTIIHHWEKTTSDMIKTMKQTNKHPFKKAQNSTQDEP